MFASSPWSISIAPRAFSQSVGATLFSVVNYCFIIIFPLHARTLPTPKSSGAASNYNISIFFSAPSGMDTTYYCCYFSAVLLRYGALFWNVKHIHSPRRQWAGGGLPTYDSPPLLPSSSEIDFPKMDCANYGEGNVHEMVVFSVSVHVCVCVYGFGSPLSRVRMFLMVFFVSTPDDATNSWVHKRHPGAP